HQGGVPVEALFADLRGRVAGLSAVPLEDLDQGGFLTADVPPGALNHLDAVGVQGRAEVRLFPAEAGEVRSQAVVRFVVLVAAVNSLRSHARIVPYQLFLSPRSG